MRSFSAFLTVLALAAAAAAQSPRAQSLLPESTAPPPADETVRGLLLDFERLFDSLRNSGGVKEKNLDILRAFDGKIDAALATRADDPHLLALSIQLAAWMKDDDAMDEGFRRLIAATDGDEAYIDGWISHYKRARVNEKVSVIYEEIATTYPDNVSVRLAWADELVRQCRFPRALDLLEQTSFETADNPRSVLTLAECYMAEDRFDQIGPLLDGIPETVIAEDASVKARSELMGKQAALYMEEWAREQEVRSAQLRADDLPRVEFTTARGTFTAELFENEAPNTVANFVTLAEDGFFDGTKFTTLVPGYSIEAGDPLTRIGGLISSGRNPGYLIPDEHTEPGARAHFSGSLSMNRGRDADSGGCLFTINFRPAPERNGQNTVFGRIIDGLDVARSLRQTDALESVKVIRKREHEYEPRTLPLIGDAPSPTEAAPTLAPTLAPIPAPTTAPAASPSGTP